jgi:hypothetical protein
MVEFCGSIRIMAKMTTCPKKDQTVKILKCGIDKNNYFFHVI